MDFGAYRCTIEDGRVELVRMRWPLTTALTLLSAGAGILAWLALSPTGTCDLHPVLCALATLGGAAVAAAGALCCWLFSMTVSRVLVGRASATLTWGNVVLPTSAIRGVRLEVVNPTRPGIVFYSLVLEVDGRLLRTPVGGADALDRSPPQMAAAGAIAACLPSPPEVRIGVVESPPVTAHRPTPATAHPLIGICGAIMVLIGGMVAAGGLLAVARGEGVKNLGVTAVFAALALYGLDLVYRTLWPRPTTGIFDGSLGLARAVGGFVLFASLFTVVLLVGRWSADDRVGRASMAMIALLFGSIAAACARGLWRRLGPSRSEASRRR